MIIEIKIFSSLRQYIAPSDSRLDEDKWDIWDGATVGEVLKVLNLPEPQNLILLINGRHGASEEVLSDGDVLSVFPPIGGG